MEYIKKNIMLIIFVILVIISCIVLVLSKKSKEDGYYEREEVTLKNYEVNEYIPVNITYDQMARIYLQEYIYKILNDREEAYNLLDANYRKEKFGSYEKFNEYIEGILSDKTRQAVVLKYAVTDKSNYRDFDIIDANNNLFIFRETGVLQYRVYFDRYTVSMK